MKHVLSFVVMRYPAVNSSINEKFSASSLQGYKRSKCRWGVQIKGCTFDYFSK